MTDFPLNLKKALQTNRLEIFIQQEQLRGAGPVTRADLLTAIAAVARPMALRAEASDLPCAVERIDEKSAATDEPLPAGAEGQFDPAGALSSRPQASTARVRRRTSPSAA